MFVREEHCPDAVCAGGRKCEAEDLPQEPIRHLQEDAGAVAGVRLAAAGAAVLEIDQDFERARDDRVRSAAGYVNDEADTARVVLERRIIEAGPLRRIDSVSTDASFMADPLPSAK
jgi:hypothetical protein